MKFLWFHLMPHTRLPEDFAEKHPSVWVDIDPDLLDRPGGAGDPDVVAEDVDRPQGCHDVLEELVHVDRLGDVAPCEADAVREVVSLTGKVGHVYPGAGLEECIDHGASDA